MYVIEIKNSHTLNTKTLVNLDKPQQPLKTQNLSCFYLMMNKKMQPTIGYQIFY